MDNCPECGLDRELVGFRHRCVPTPVVPPNKGNERQRPGIVGGADVPQKVGAVRPVGPKTYQYRDPVKRRAQVARAMRKYRARKHAVQESRT